tara:strand:- start:287 stop:568 length:282 start_codon:yes stop_codon:yes gene_type:complete
MNTEQYEERRKIFKHLAKMMRDADEMSSNDFISKYAKDNKERWGLGIKFERMTREEIKEMIEDFIETYPLSIEYETSKVLRAEASRLFLMSMV